MINWHEPEALTKALDELKISIDQLALDSGVSRAQLFRLQSGNTLPRRDTDPNIRVAIDRPKSGAVTGTAAPHRPGLPPAHTASHRQRTRLNPSHYCAPRLPSPPPP